MDLCVRLLHRLVSFQGFDEPLIGPPQEHEPCQAPPPADWAQRRSG